MPSSSGQIWVETDVLGVLVACVDTVDFPVVTDEEGDDVGLVDDGIEAVPVVALLDRGEVSEPSCPTVVVSSGPSVFTVLNSVVVSVVPVLELRIVPVVPCVLVRLEP